MRTAGYGSYRGGSGLRRFLKGMALVMGVLLVLCVAGFYVLQQYIVYTAEGPRLELPFFKSPPVESVSPPASSEPVESAPIVVVTPPPEPEPEPVAGQRLVFLPREVMFSGTAAARLNQIGAEGGIYDMKTDLGDLGYVSALELAIAAKATASDVTLGIAIPDYIEKAAYTVARVSCFKDPRLGLVDRTMNLLTNSGYLWTDPDGIRWTSPVNEQVVEYLAGVCVELAQLGFDEILLENAHYPPGGNLGYIRPGDQYRKADFEANVAAFYARIQEVLAPYDTRLSVRTDADTLTAGYNERTGQGTSNLAIADRIYLETDDPAPFLEQMREAGMEDPESNIIAIVSAMGDETAAWAVKEEG